MWIDIGAGPVSWGPRFSGEGLVNSRFIPYAGNYVNSTLEIPADQQRQLMIDLASWVRRSVELVVCPAVDHLPFLLSPSRDPDHIHIQLIRITDNSPNEKSENIVSAILLRMIRDSV